MVKTARPWEASECVEDTRSELFPAGQTQIETTQCLVGFFMDTGDIHLRRHIPPLIPVSEFVQGLK